MAKKIDSNETDKSKAFVVQKIQKIFSHQKRKAFFSAAEIKKMLKSGSLVIGTERTIKSLRLGRVQKVLVSSNCPADVEKDINYYAGLSGAEFYKLTYQNDELSTICKKPFSISVLALLKGVSK